MRLQSLCEQVGDGLVLDGFDLREQAAVAGHPFLGTRLLNVDRSGSCGCRLSIGKSNIGVRNIQ